LSQSDQSLPPERREAYHRGMAAEALRLAQTASDEAQKESYIDIAARWNLLAAQTECRMTQKSESRNSSPKSQSNGDSH
jgi:hypothetical protein